MPKSNKPCAYRSRAAQYRTLPDIRNDLEAARNNVRNERQEVRAEVNRNEGEIPLDVHPEEQMENQAEQRTHDQQDVNNEREEADVEVHHVEEFVLNVHAEGDVENEAGGDGRNRPADGDEDDVCTDCEDDRGDVSDDGGYDRQEGAYDELHGENEEDAVTSEDEGSDDENDGMDPALPLYFKSHVTVRDSMVMVLNLMLQHNLTGSCVSDLLHMINLLCPRAGLQHLSYYKFRKFFHCSKTALNKKYYCSHCCYALATPNDACPICAERRGVSYFIQLPLIPQLRELYKRQSFYNNLQHKFHRNRVGDNVEDIYDGSVYQEQVQSGILSDRNNISFTWYTDGAPVFKSKNYSIWPFCYLINELPYKMRVGRENVLLGGLWFGPKKPSANLFMKSFLPDLTMLHDGVHITPADLGVEILVRGIVIAGVCDTQANSNFLNTVSHCGFNSCPVCEIGGKTLVCEGGTDKHVFRYQQNVTLRTVERFQDFARQAILSQNSVAGVKGPTVLRLFMPDFLKGTAIDPMHLVTGVVKKLLMLHFSSSCSQYRFSVRGVLDAADVELLNIKPPKYIHRVARSLEDYDRWKASELQTWFFFYSIPIYKNILPDQYFHHYLKFVAAIAYLNSKSVSPQIIDIAEQLLTDFVRDFEVLYDLKFCTIDIHLLLHLGACVRQLGPLWVYSCLPLENLNGLVLGTFHGKTSVDTQFCNAFWQVLSLHYKIEAIPEGPIKEFLTKRKRSVNMNERIADACYSVGTYSRNGVNHPLVTRSLRASNVVPGRLSVYFRLLKDGMIYVCERYSHNTASTSSYVAFERDGNIEYGSVHSFVKVSRCDCAEMCHCPNEHYAIIRIADKCESFRIPYYQNFPLPYIHKFQFTTSIKAIPVSHLKTVCIYMSVFNSFYIAEPLNSFEVE